MQDSFINSPLVYSIALTLIHFIWQGALIALVLKTALIFIPHQKSQLRYAYTSGAMIVNLLAPIITFFIIYSPENLQFSQNSSQTLISNIDLTQSLISKDWHANFVEYLPYLTFIWLCGITGLSLKFLVELYTVNQLAKTNTIKPENDLYNRFKTLSAKVGLLKTPQLFLSLNTHVPMAIGWLKPVVLIPVSMLTGLTPAQLDMLMLHELAHIRRHDYVINFIQSIVEIILFFHPCVLWVSNQMRNEREYCSDDIAVAHSGNSIAYAHTLADTASLCNKKSHHSIPNMAMAASGGDLTQRVIRLVNEHHCSSNNQISKWFASLAVLSVVLLVSSQHLIKFLNTASLTPTVRVSDSPIMTPTDNYYSAKALLTEFVSNNYVEKNKPEENYSLINVNDDKQTDKTQIHIKNEPNINAIQKSTASTQTKILETHSKIEERLTSKKSLTNEMLEDYQQQSLSDLAFKKTDSSYTSSASHNRYSEQLSELNSQLSQDTENALIKKTETVEAIDLPPHSLDFKIEKNLTPKVGSTKNDVSNNTLSNSSYNTHYTNHNAKLIYSVSPKYPVIAKRKGIEIEVKVNFTIDENGYVQNVDFPAIKHHRNFFKSAVRLAMEKWRFIPAQRNGKAVESEMSKIFSFSLEE